MRFVIQRVLNANVKVDGNIVGSINQGLLVLMGINSNDKESDLDFAANKLLNIRLWPNNKGVTWKEGVKQKGYEILLVSQFTLYAFLKGNKPDFHYAMEPEKAKIMYNKFTELLKKKLGQDKIQSGIFGAMMEVSLVNDGPVTINWDYPEIRMDKLLENVNNTNIYSSPEPELKHEKKNNINKGDNVNSNFPVTNEDIEKQKLDFERNTSLPLLVSDKKNKKDNIESDQINI